jgi:hypothetical protein
MRAAPRGVPSSGGLLLEFSRGEGALAGVLLQELAVAAATPKIMEDTGEILRFQSTLQDVNPNRNRRLYTEDVLSHAIAAPPVQERLRTRTMYGEANHPFSDDLKRQMIVDGTRVSHLTVGLEQPKNGVVRGIVETAATQTGRDMRGLIVHNKSTVAFSMRGMGGIRRVPGKDLVEVTKPLCLVTYDWVTYPSHQTAYMDTLHEGHVAFVGHDEALAYAKDQSANYRSIMEQGEFEPDGLVLTEDQRAIIVRSGRTVVASFLESDIRREFRAALLGR